MNSLSKKDLFFKNQGLKHLLFWLCVYAYFIGTANMNYYSGYEEVTEHFSIYIVCQIIVAYSCLYFLIPTFLTPKKHFQFVLSLILQLAAVFVLFVGFHEYYHQPNFFKIVNGVTYDSNKMFWEKLLNPRIFIGKSAIILTPTILLVIAQFYKAQQSYLQYNEQKTANELAALKHQLNPHFLFNTLNNLYALSINKSDKAPEVIAKLSEMLDYMLYGCEDNYVILDKEIELIENYLALEKLRYDERVDINFTKDVATNAKIAPLILLTFIENAFKHGVSQELKKASILIKIAIEEDTIQFNITNSIASNKFSNNKETIGLINIKKQLDLLYLDDYALRINEGTHHFKVHLKLPVK